LHNFSLVKIFKYITSSHSKNYKFYKKIKLAIVSNAKFLKADTKLLAEVFLDGTITMAMIGSQAMEAPNNNQTYKLFGNWFSVNQVNNAISRIKIKCTLAED
jgi:hypothetical protein